MGVWNFSWPVKDGKGLGQLGKGRKSCDSLGETYQLLKVEEGPLMAMDRLDYAAITNMPNSWWINLSKLTLPLSYKSVVDGLRSPL